MTERIFNFSAGPAVIPVPVLEEAQRDMLSLPGVGMSVMEISHRSKTFDEIIGRAESGRREFAVFNGADEFSAGGRQRRLRAHRKLGKEGAKGSEEGWRREHCGDDG